MRKQIVLKANEHPVRLRACLFGAASLLFGAAAQAVPVGTYYTHSGNGSCTTASGPLSSTCQLSGGWGSIHSVASLQNLSAETRIDAYGYAFLASAVVTYYFELNSSTGTFEDARIPLLVSAYGTAAVGNGSDVLGGGAGFNNNTASATVKIGSSTRYACAGVGCPLNTPTSFSGDYMTYVQPFGSSTPIDGNGNIFTVELYTRVSSNSNYEHSYAYAFADPYIRIDPEFLALNPQYSLTFSANVSQVPLSSSALLFASGIVGLAGLRRRMRTA